VVLSIEEASSINTNEEAEGIMERQHLQSIVRESSLFHSLSSSAALGTALPRDLVVLIVLFTLNATDVAVALERRGAWKLAFERYQLINQNTTSTATGDDALHGFDHLHALYKIAFCYLAGLNAVMIDEVKGVLLLENVLWLGDRNTAKGSGSLSPSNRSDNSPNNIPGEVSALLQDARSMLAECATNGVGMSADYTRAVSLCGSTGLVSDCYSKLLTASQLEKTVSGAPSARLKTHNQLVFARATARRQAGIAQLEELAAGPPDAVSGTASASSLPSSSSGTDCSDKIPALTLTRSSGSGGSSGGSGSNRGDVRAQMLLGTCYRSGSGVRLSCETARKWWTLAAARGHVQAQLGLALVAEFDDDDLPAAIRWLERAAAQGSSQAIMLLSQKRQRIPVATVVELPELPKPSSSSPRN